MLLVDGIRPIGASIAIVPAHETANGMSVTMAAVIVAIVATVVFYLRRQHKHIITRMIHH